MTGARTDAASSGSAGPPEALIVATEDPLDQPQLRAARWRPATPPLVALLPVLLLGLVTGYMATSEASGLVLLAFAGTAVQVAAFFYLTRRVLRRGVAISAAIDEVTRAAIIRPTMTGPNSRTMPMATIWGTTASALKRAPPA